MKDDLVYPYYLSYLNDRLLENKISNGSFSLLKISKSSFDNFKHRFENDDYFYDKVKDIYKSDRRDKKIDDIIDDEAD